MNTKAIENPGFLIDLDGLLINSETISKVAFERLCGEFGCEFTDSYHASIRGKVESQWSREFVQQFHLQASPDEIANRHRKLLTDELNHSVQLMPGARDLLDWIDEMNYPSALVTSSDRGYASTYTSRLGIGRFFKWMVTAEDVQNGKPDPEPYILAARKIGRDPRFCIVLEDSVNGVISGKASGATVIAVPSSAFDRESLKDSNYVVESLNEALEVVKGMGL